MKNQFDGETLLLTGGSGMTGAAIAAHLLARFPGLCIRQVYYSTPPALHHSRLESVRADLRDRRAAAMVAEGCSLAVLAAAGTGGAAAALSDPAQQTTDNLVMDALTLEALQRAGVRRCVYFSSAIVYPECEGAIKEGDLDWNADPHPSYFGVGWAKRAAEKLCQFWHEKYGMECVVLRAANLFGPRARFDPQRSNFIPALIRKAVDGLDPFEVWGKPEVERDVLYVADAAGAVAAALTADCSFEVFNLGSGETVCVGDVVDWALAAAGHRPAGGVVYRSDRPTTIRRRVLDCSRIRECLGWQPEYSPREGVLLTTRWWQENQETWSR